MVPVITEVVGVGEPVARPPREIAQVNPAGIVGEIDAVGIRNPILPAPELETVQVLILPAHRYLEDVVQLGQGGITPHERLPADLWVNAQQVDLELVNRRRAVIAGGGRRRSGWGHGVHRQRWAPKLRQQVVAP